MFEPGKLADLIGEAKPAHGIFSLPAMIAWLETKSRDDAYCYSDNGHCLIAQYLISAGLPVRGVGGDYWRDEPTRQEHPLPEWMRTVAQRGIHTFGAALERARAYASPSLVLGVR